MSSFDEIYKKQEEFENLLIRKYSEGKQWPNKPLSEFNKKEKTAFCKDLALLLYQEVGEFVNAVGNYKTHKTQEDGKDEEEIKEEIADMLIFVLNMALTYNMMSQELIDEVEKKQKINFNRQETGY